MTLETLKKLLGSVNAEYVITRAEGNVVHVNFWIDNDDKDK